MELEDKTEAETAPRILSLEGEDKEEVDPKPAEASAVRKDEKEDSSTTLFNASGESVSALEDQGNHIVPSDATVPSLVMEQESKDEDNGHTGGDIKSLSAKAEEKVEATVEPSTLSNSVDKEKIDAKACAVTSNKLPASKNKAAASLKARAMITKKFPVTSSIKKNVRPGDPKVLRSRRMKKKGSTSTNDGVSKDERDIKESSSEDEKLPGDLSEVKTIEREEPSSGNKGKQSDSAGKDFHERIKSKTKQKFGSASKNKNRMGGGGNLQSSEEAENSRKKCGVNDTEEKQKENGNKKEKLGGLIFMCSSKTKPDCIKYRVMGVNMGKKDLVMAIQPGLKLFLYDYDLKLMYGIFKASSGGGIKLEPKAFNGAFPVQVRFTVQVECLPLPEVIFKKAMMENFTSKHKFRTELSHKQVRKLSKLFQPVALGVDPPTQLADRFSRRKRIRGENSQARERVPRHQPRAKKSSRESFDDSEARRLEVRVYGRDHRDLSTLQRVDAPRDSFLTEREYRAYGLQGERRNLTITANVDPRLPSREVYYEEDRLSRRADEIRRDTVAGHRDSLLASLRYLDDIDYRTYSRDTRPELSPATAGRSIGSTHHLYPEDQYITYRHAPTPASLVPYAERLRREDIPMSSLHGYDRARAYEYETDRVQRMEDVPIGSRSVIYTADALDEYDRAIRYRIPPADASHMPVSSRYSFAGPRI